jgi:NitT/TauT family transport system permease protein
VRTIRNRTGWLWPVLTLVIILLVLEIAARTGLVTRLIMPAPSEVGQAIVMLAQQEYFWNNFYWTAFEAGAGFVLGVALGFASGLIIGISNFARKSIYPLAVAVQSTPQVAIAPLFLIWFGFGIAPRVFFAALSCFFPVLVAVVVGLNAADQDARTLLRSLGASRWTMFRKLLLPAALPTIFAGLRLAVPSALVGAIVGEFVGGNLGLGVMITTFNSQLQIPESFAVVVVLAVMGYGSYLVVEILDRRVVSWSHREH